MTVNEKLYAVRTEMKKNSVDAVLVSNSDPHQSEYLADRWKDREWISGFTGSSGYVIITHDHAGLWTDSRYFLQAEKELAGTDIQLHKLLNQFEPEHIEWLVERLPEGSTVALDGEDFSKNQLHNIEAILKQKYISIDTNIDVLSLVWNDRPLLPSAPIFEHSPEYTGQTRLEKLTQLRQYISTADVDALLITALDEIAWLLNIRGKDVDFNPVALAFVFVSQKQVIVFADENKINSELNKNFSDEGITLMPYESIFHFLNNIDSFTKVLVDPAVINVKLYKSINCRIFHIDSPIKISKALKTKKEIEQYRQTMVLDAVALAYAFKWLEENISNGQVTEYTFGEKIASLRAQHATYVGESFNAIVGYNENGAIVHYRALKEECKTIEANGVLLVDCGGQYLGGTTDITRTIALSEPTPEVKKHNTLVLKGHIAMSQAVFPIGTSGATLDVLARQFLWSHGLNYQHGTGHGVGYFLNVHEGPHGFAGPNTDRGRTAFKPGMVITNEPGIYLENKYGIRIENILVVKESKLEKFLEFETITLYPYDLKLIDERSLTPREKAWINNYHNNVYNLVSPHLDEATKVWFKYKCKLLG